MLEDLAKMSPQADWSHLPNEHRPRCEQCGLTLVSRGKQSRWLQRCGGHRIEIERTDGTCPQGGQGIFPLEKEWERDGSDLTPHAQEGLVRLAPWVPGEQAAKLLQALLGVQVSKASARRVTLQAASAVVQDWETEANHLKHDLPEASPGAEKHVMSADGALVPLVGGGWAEVKTLVIGTVKTNKAGEPQMQDLSDWSRLTDGPGFEKATLGETPRRGLENAHAGAAGMDGAEWLQGVIEYHRADAVRLLDCPHAAEYGSARGEAV